VVSQTEIMNIFAKKLSASTPDSLPIAPIKLYQTCAYKEGFGYLRGIQEEVLNIWHSKRDQRDTICKMNTGSGKTLTGLLMLYSKLVEKAGPCIYIVPDDQLLRQTVQLASNYGIPVCEFSASSSYPADFINLKAILVTTFKKVFNGKTLFNKEKIQIGALLFDDAHKCVDIAREQTTIKLARSHTISRQLFSLFTDSLKHQSMGTFQRVDGQDPFYVAKVPYWTWMNNHENILRIINAYIKTIDSDYSNTENIKFQWDLINNNLLEYECFIGGDYIEISPIHVPYHEVPAINEAKFRFILSATFEDDFDLIKDFGISVDSIVNPIIPNDRNDIGKRLILAPSRFDTSLTDETMRKFIAEYHKKSYNTVVLVPSNARAKAWENIGATFVNKDNIEGAINALRSSKNNFFVFSNRYDGIDLNNDLCRILVIDGLPMFSSLQEQYNESRSDTLKAGKKAQIIEQGLGRSARSGADYSVVFLMGTDLINFLGYDTNLSYFTPVTKAQLELGLTLLDGESSNNPLTTISETANYCLSQDPSWHQYHTQALLNVSAEVLGEGKRQKLINADIERKSLSFFKRRQYKEAGQLIIDEIVNKTTVEKEQAWYLQFAAQLIYLGDPITSNNLQIKACNITTRMFHPQFEHIYKQLKTKGVQGAQVKKIIESYSRPQDITISTESLINELQYNSNIDARKFENKLAEIGKFLGFSVQMPDRELGIGPDVLWCMTDSHYLLMEAKSEKENGDISKEDLSQLYSAEAWFNEFYPEMNYSLVTLQRSNKKTGSASVKHECTKVIDADALNSLHENLRRFVSALQGRETKGFNEEEIATLLVVHHFTPELFKQYYLKSIKS
jgi:hypothetical protein